MAIIAVKRCHSGVATEDETKYMKTLADRQQYISSYFTKFHILHTIVLICGSIIIIYGFIDLVSTDDEDIKYAFHFISVFVIFIVSVLSLYAAFTAYEKPCTSTPDSTCCQVIAAPKLFAVSDRPRVTAFSERDTSMIAVIALDGLAAILLFLTSVLYFVDTRRDAKLSGYLEKVHNSNYLSRV
ncbi:uncharacterized protein LOC128961167 [Oppia nitens]|uniref:uncharacterized protein LOC128961167 n=1 Tax=Oppia nitens TaxID=1686743 RepID=UPI0023DC6CCE|nr:uncharacterized protein LOC128961167 [Oppia nitens]